VSDRRITSVTERITLPMFHGILCIVTILSVLLGSSSPRHLLTSLLQVHLCGSHVPFSVYTDMFLRILVGFVHSRLVPLPSLFFLQMQVEFVGTRKCYRMTMSGGVRTHVQSLSFVLVSQHPFYSVSWPTCSGFPH